MPLLLSRACPRRRLYSFRFNSTSTRTRRNLENLIPKEPTWSVNDLLSSYPKPTLSDATLKHMHNLSALIPPKEGMPEHAKLKVEMEEMIRLVDAVRLAKDEHTSARESSLHSSREDLYALDELDKQKTVTPVPDVSGRDLLKHASVTRDNLYVVESDRKRH